MDPPELNRQDVYLRVLRPDDARAWFEYLSDPTAIELTSYDVRSIDEVRSMIAGYATTRDAGGPARWAIAVRENDALVGTCGFHSWAPGDRRAEIGYDLAPALWGRGIASDAVAATVTSAFATTDLNRVDAYVMAENTASQRVLEKCGFTKEGRLARYRNCRGTFRDFYVYGLVRLTRTPAKTYAFPPDIEAEITFVPAEQGGRATPAFSGYRPQFYYDGHDWDAEQEYPDVESVLPGQTVRALLRFLSPDAHVGRVHPGLEFQVREGPRVVAHGRVTKILHLAESAERNKNRR